MNLAKLSTKATGRQRAWFGRFAPSHRPDFDRGDNRIAMTLGVRASFQGQDDRAVAMAPRANLG